MTIISTDDARAIAAVGALRSGDTARLTALLAQYPELVACTIRDDDCTDGERGRTLLHVVTDWPGHFPNAATAVQLLVSAGADVNGRFSGPHTETPLHWAASSDDVEALDALLDAGADIDAPGAVIGGGTPLADATAFGNWRSARRLIERGAHSSFWEAATLGLRDRVDRYLSGDAPPTIEDITAAFWGACHGGQLEMAQHLLELGADANWIGWDDLTALDAARRSEATDVVEWLVQQQ
jgi:ankyrin repeat protein